MFQTLTNPIMQWLNDYAPYGIFVTDANLFIRGWNNWLQRHSGRAAADVIGVPLFDALPEIRDRGLDMFYREVLNGHTHVLAHRFHEYLIVLPTDFHPSAGRMRQTARIAPLEENGAITGTLTMIEDVTERMVTESELSRAREEAERANKAKDHLLATLSHDLRTPLTSIMGWIRVMEGRPLSEEQTTKALKTIESNTLIQIQLLDAILDTARIASGKIELMRGSADLIQIIRNAVDALTPVAELKQVRLESEIPGQEVSCFLDSKRFHQIVWNLLSNAIKFTSSGGVVRVSLIERPEGLLLRVSDTGMGIAAEDLDHVFDALWQSPGATGHGGLGLGLSITRQLVELHGGSIHAESRGQGQGATFVVSLPHAMANLAQ